MSALAVEVGAALDRLARAASLQADRARLSPLMTRYPEIRVRSASRNPLAVVAAVRHELRRAGVDRGEIERFSAEALAASDPLGILDVCRQWVGKADAPR